MLEHLDRQVVSGQLGLVLLVDRGITLVDRGITATPTLGRHHDVEVRRVGWDDTLETPALTCEYCVYVQRCWTYTVA